MNEILKYTCPKCGNKQYEIGEMWTVGSFWTRMFEFHNRRFTYVTCRIASSLNCIKFQRRKLER